MTFSENIISSPFLLSISSAVLQKCTQGAVVNTPILVRVVAWCRHYLNQCCHLSDKPSAEPLSTGITDFSLHHHDHSGNSIPDSKVHGPTWGPPGSCRPQMGPMLAPWTLLSWIIIVWPHPANNWYEGHNIGVPFVLCIFDIMITPSG